MPKAKLTARTVENLKPPASGQVEHFDEALPGFALRITDKGRKSWVLFYRVKDGPEKGKLRRLTLGEYPLLSLGDGRAAAQEALRRVERGGDPAKEKQNAKREPKARVYTAQDIADAYLEEYAKPRKRSWRQDERILRVYVNSVWKDRPVTSITPADVDELLDGIVKRGTPIMANRTLAVVRKMFRWAAKKPRFQIAASPVIDISAPAPAKKRERYLNDNEVRLFWQACKIVGYPFGPCGQLLLLTCARRNMVASMRWADIDQGNMLWRVPPEAMKSGRELFIPLPDMAMRIIGGVPRIGGTEFVFPAKRGGAGHVRGFDHGKRAIAAKMQELAHEEADDPENSAPIPNWTFHDLRRTGVTHMGQLRVPKHIRQRIVDHVETDTLSSVYDRFEYLDERREALEAWAGKTERLLAPAEDNVVPLRG